MIELKINGLNDLLKIADKYPSASEKHINKAIQNSLIRIQDQAKREAPFGVSGNLRQNWQISLGRFTGRLTSKAQNQGYNYGVAVEYGTRPHYVSAKKLARWGNRKGINPYALANSIAKKGTKANPFLQRSKDKQESNVNKEFDKALENIINDL